MSVHTPSTKQPLDGADTRGQDVETMLAFAAALALVAPVPTLDAQHLPRLPGRGFARQVGTAVELQTLRGHPIGRVQGFRIAQPRATHGLLLKRGRAEYALDVFARRIRAVFPMGLAPRGCRFMDATRTTRLVVCGRTMRIGATVVGGAGRLGHWEWAEFSPDARQVLAYWSTARGVATTYVVDLARPHPGRLVAGEAVPLGWLGSEPVVHLRSVLCKGKCPAGVYAFDEREGKLLVRVSAVETYAMWGG